MRIRQAFASLAFANHSSHTALPLTLRVNMLRAHEVARRVRANWHRAEIERAVPLPDFSEQPCRISRVSGKPETAAVSNDCPTSPESCPPVPWTLSHGPVHRGREAHADALTARVVLAKRGRRGRPTLLPPVELLDALDTSSLKPRRQSQRDEPLELLPKACMKLLDTASHRQQVWSWESRGKDASQYALITHLLEHKWS